MAVGLNIGITGDKQVNEIILDPLKKRVKDIRPAWAAIHNFLMTVIGKQFETEGDRTARWQALSPIYAARKRAQFPGKKILRLTDRLFHSFTNPAHSDHVFKSTPRTMTFGTKVHYAAHHQLGGSFALESGPLVNEADVGKSVTLPQRRILSLTKKDRLEVRNRVREHLTGQRASGVTRLVGS